MQDETIEDQNELIALLQEHGWDVTRIETVEREYQPHADQEVTQLRYELLITKEHRKGFDNPYQVQ